MFIYSKVAPSATLALYPRAPYPLHPHPKFCGTYLVIAGLGGAP